MFQFLVEHPLPKRQMVLSSIVLNQEFIGFLEKQGKYFLGCMHSMHRIRSNATLLFSYLVHYHICTTNL